MSGLNHISTCIIIFTLSVAFYSVTPKITTNGYTFFIRLNHHKNNHFYLFICPFINPFKILLFSNISTSIMFIYIFLFVLLLALSNCNYLFDVLVNYAKPAVSSAFFQIVETNSHHWLINQHLCVFSLQYIVTSFKDSISFLTIYLASIKSIGSYCFSCFWNLFNF